MPPPFHQCHAAKANGQRCNYNSRFHDNRLCATHDRMRREYEHLWNTNPWIQANRQPYQLPVWNAPAAPAPPPAPEPEPEVVEVIPPPVQVRDCESCGGGLPRYRVQQGLRFCSYCTIHRNRPDLPAEQRCAYHTHGGRRKECFKARQGEHDMCRTHFKLTTSLMCRKNIKNAIVLIRDHQADWPQIIHAAFAGPGRDSPWYFGFRQSDLHQAAVEIAIACRIPELYNQQQREYYYRNFPHRAPRMDEHGVVHQNPRMFVDRDDLPPPRTDLEAFTRDRQNVHTAVVTDMTNKNVEILLQTPGEETDLAKLLCQLSSDIRSMVEGSLSPPVDELHAVFKDVASWWNRKSCRMVDDRLYQNLLRSLWSRIQKSGSFKKDLEKRLWEEMVDSLGMCCDGHINRLANVMVGFDDAFQAQVSTGETLQNRMAAIAEMEIETEKKVEMANTVFAELAVPEPDRQAWLEAF